MAVIYWMTTFILLFGCVYISDYSFRIAQKIVKKQIEPKKNDVTLRRKLNSNVCDQQSWADISEHELNELEIVQMRQMNNKIKDGLKGTVIRSESEKMNELHNKVIDKWVKLIGTSRHQEALQKLAEISEWYKQNHQAFNQKRIIDRLVYSAKFNGENQWDSLIETIDVLGGPSMNRRHYRELVQRLTNQWFYSQNKDKRVLVLNEKINGVQHILDKMIVTNANLMRGNTDQVHLSMVHHLIKSFILHRYPELHHFMIRTQLVRIMRKGKMAWDQRLKILDQEYKRIIASGHFDFSI